MKSRNIIRVICAALVICFAVCGLVACGNDKVKVTVNDNGKKTEVEIEAGKTVADALDLAKITLGDTDTCEPKKDEKITKDTKEITVTRGATEMKVSLTVNGKTTEIATKATTVQELLTEQGITLGAGDGVSPKVDEPLTAGMQITVTRAQAETKAPATEKPTEAEVVETEAPQENNNGGEEVPADNGGEDYNNDSGNNDSGNEDGGNEDGGDNGGVYEVSRQAMPDCDGSGHGYYIITYSDGSTGTEEY